MCVSLLAVTSLYALYWRRTPPQPAAARESKVKPCLGKEAANERLGFDVSNLDASFMPLPLHLPPTPHQPYPSSSLQLREVTWRVDTLVRLRRAENMRALAEGARFLLHASVSTGRGWGGGGEGGGIGQIGATGESVQRGAGRERWRGKAGKGWGRGERGGQGTKGGGCPV